MPTRAQLGVAVLVGLGLATATARAEEQRVVGDRIVAVIDDQIITLRELEAKAGPYMGQLADVSDPKVREQRRQEILRQVLDIEVGDRIVSREIERTKDRLGVTDQDIDRAVQEVLRMNKITQEQLQAALYGQGLTWNEYRSKLRSQLERSRLIQYSVQGRVQVKDDDVRRRCEERQNGDERSEQVCAAHVLLRVPEKADEKTVEQIRGRAAKLQAELASGADFAAYALKYSEDKAAPDGNLGCFSRGEMLEPFEEAAYKLKPGGVSSVVRTRFGFHVIKVLERKHPPAASCHDEKVLDEVHNALYQEEMDRQMSLWLTDLKKKAFVEVRL